MRIKNGILHLYFPDSMPPIPLAAPFIVKDGRILLLFRKKHNHYEPPGGKVEPGETFEQAAIREVKEEIGCDVELGEYLGFCDFEIEKKNWRCHYFFGNIKDGQEPKIMEPDKFEDFNWVEIKNYKDYSLSPPTINFCERYLKGEIKEQSN